MNAGPTRLRIALFDGFAEALQLAGVRLSDDSRTVILNKLEEKVRGQMQQLAAREMLREREEARPATIKRDESMLSFQVERLNEHGGTDQILALTQTISLALAAFEAAKEINVGKRLRVRQGGRVIDETDPGRREQAL